MIVQSSSINKKPDYHSPSTANLMLRMDGFQKVVKCLSYKRNSCNMMVRSEKGSYSSMGKRPATRQIDIVKQSDSRLDYQ
jgi:hypothetical protein